MRLKANTCYLATTTALTAVENKMPNVSNLVNNIDYNTKISKTEKKITDHDHDKYINTPEFNKLTAENLTTRLGQVNSASKNDIAGSVKKTDFDEKLENVNKQIT